MKQKEKSGESTCQWQVKTRMDVLGQLGLSIGQIGAFAALFGNTKVQIKGKAKVTTEISEYFVGSRARFGGVMPEQQSP
jgi:hypothetical protein